MTPHKRVILAVDQGTSSTRCMLFDSSGTVLAVHQTEFTQFYPKAGWVEHDPEEIFDTVRLCTNKALEHAGLTKDAIQAVGIANQRETTVAWDSSSGHPLAPAIVWLDVRTEDLVARLVEAQEGRANAVQHKCGLPFSTYFSGPKMRWLLDNNANVQAAFARGTLRFGTIDSWLIHKLTAGLVHATDVTNASRTMLMNLTTKAWDPDLCQALGVPIDSLPAICSNSEICGIAAVEWLVGVPIGCSIGDQHAAMVGQCCFVAGMGKTTYGTGCFSMVNTGSVPLLSESGLLTTVGYQLGPHDPVTYALEGAVACAGRGIEWLRDNMGLIVDATELEALANSVPDSGGVTLVPAFSGLFAPRWRMDARGVIVGLSLHSTKAHIARALLEAVALQCYDLAQAMERDLGTPLTHVCVDGGMTVNRLLMQMQADLLQCAVRRARMKEATALGAAFCAGLAVGMWTGVKDLERIKLAAGEDLFLPAASPESSAGTIARWQDAVQRSFNLDKFK